MSGGRIITTSAIAGIAASLILGATSYAHKRAEYFQVVLNDVAKSAGTAPIGHTRVKLIGCDWQFGETVTATTKFGDDPATITLCRNRGGVLRMTITSTTTRIIDGKPD